MLTKPDETKTYKITRLCVLIVLALAALWAVLIGIDLLVNALWHPYLDDSSSLGVIFELIFIPAFAGSAMVGGFLAPIIGFINGVTLLCITKSAKRRWFAVGSILISVGALAAFLFLLQKL